MNVDGTLDKVRRILINANNNAKSIGLSQSQEDQLYVYVSGTPNENARILGVKAPQVNSEAATKEYVDNK